MEDTLVERLQNEVLILTDRVSRETARANLAEMMLAEMAAEVDRCHGRIQYLEAEFKSVRVAVDDTLTQSLLLGAHDPPPTVS